MKPERIMLDHGSGGRISHRLISELMVPIFDNPILSRLDDSAVLDMPSGRWAFSTDTYVVDPIFFPGGNIGDLAVNGTVNDLAMCGADPLFLSVGLILEEGFSSSDLEAVLKTMREAADRAGVSIVTGDTKVVQKGAADKIFINTSGIGPIPEGVEISGRNAKAGDRIILNGSIAEHGIAVLTQREGLRFESPVKSDSAPLNHLVRRMLSTGKEIHTLRDPTRGGLGTTLNEIAACSGVVIKIYEETIPVKKEVLGICELLGFDPLYIANEGKLVAFVAKDASDDLLGAMRQDPNGKNACVIGEVLSDHGSKVIMQTRIGGMRIVDMLTGEQLPRIC